MTDGTREGAWPEFLRLWEGLASESRREGTVIVVEGERDRAALRALGIEGPIVLAHQGRRLGVLAQSLTRAGRRVIVLTDWDLPGGQIARKLREFLAPSPVELDLEFRRRLARALRGEVTHVEGLSGWARRMAERSGAPIDHFLAIEDRPEAGPTG